MLVDVIYGFIYSAIVVADTGWFALFFCYGVRVVLIQPTSSPRPIPLVYNKITHQVGCGTEAIPEPV